jgi:hypothetical protein
MYPFVGDEDEVGVAASAACPFPFAGDGPMAPFVVVAEPASESAGEVEERFDDDV